MKLPLSLKDYFCFVTADLYRHKGKCNLREFSWQCLTNPSFRYVFWMRTSALLKGRRLLYPVFVLVRILAKHNECKFGISVPYTSDIGPGLYIGHHGCIVVSGIAKLGRNCNLSQGVTIGVKNRGKYKGAPIIGNNVYVGPGAKIIGAVKVGNNVAIGANCVVTHDIEDDSVVVGVPGRVISHLGAESYIENTRHNGQIES
jgi:serine O-acetyltransferase